MSIIYIFLILSIVNVIFSTIRSIVLVGNNAILASLLSGGYYAFYNIMLIYSVADFPMWEKCLITFICNVLGVLIVKLVEKKLQKDRLWKVELSVNGKHFQAIENFLIENELPYNYNEYGKHIMFNVYCEKQADTQKVSELVKLYNGKYFVSENRSVLN